MHFDSKEIIHALIKADFCNHKLISGLEKAGLTSEDFHGDLETVILYLMGFDLEKREDELHEFYYETKERLLDIEVKEFRKKLNEVTIVMYEKLILKSET